MDKTSIKTTAQTLIESYSHDDEQKIFPICGARSAGKSEYLRSLVREHLKKGELMTLKERFAEVVAENHILKQSCFFGNDKRAHDIALAALKMEWKKGEIHHQNDSGSMRYYLAAYKYILEQLEADQNKD